MHTERKADAWDRQTDRQTAKQTNKQTDRQTVIAKKKAGELTNDTSQPLHIYLPASREP